MAAKIQDVGSNVVPIKKKGGRPPGSKNRPRAKSAAMKVTAETGITIIEEDFLPSAKDTAPETAPSFGHNEPDESAFLQHVGKVRRQQEKIEVKKLELKHERKVLKDVRMAAREAGIVLGQLDDALDDLETEQVDLIDRERRRLLYHRWLGIPLDEASEPRKSAPKAPSPEDEAARWRKLGEQHGRLGKARELPEGLPGEHMQAYLKGHDIGQEALMRGLPLTKDGFEPKADKGAPAPAEAATEGAPVLILGPEHFATGTELVGANLRTLLPGFVEGFEAAERVVALFGTSKRVLKEPDADLPGGVYIDTGEDDAPVSDPEPVSAAELT